MATLSKTDSRRMYSWWWNSHISPKNSKWLQENLTDVDIKVKAMIKLIEEDADSFARRAEMYYKKRPELMKLVEELYRAYRALAERYDHATGALRQAHKTMTEAFPNQVPLTPDDPSTNSPYDSDPQTPRTATRACFDPDDLLKRNGSMDEDSDASSHKGLKQLNELVGSTGTVRRGLNFGDSDDGNNKHRSQARALSEFETDKEIVLLKESVAKFEDEKEAGLKQYQESLERLSKLEAEISNAQEDSRELANRASEAEAEAQTLKDSLHRLETEKEESLKLYHEGLEKISDLENALAHARETVVELHEQAREGENVTRNLKQEIAELEKKLAEAEKEARDFRERAEKAESEVETLKLAIDKLNDEKEAQALLYKQCLETISGLEVRLTCAHEEAEKLKSDIENGVSLLKGAEEQRLMLERSNKTLHTELESMVLKMGTQTEELTEKQKELGRLWTCIQEERLRFLEAETAFQTLQQLHSQSQEELRSLAAELQNRARVLTDIETRNRALEGEIQKHVEENKNLNELNLSVIGSLKESNGKLEKEVELRVDERNALQQEIYCLKEELNELNKNHGSILDQVAYVGLNPESLGSSVKELQDENSKLKEEWETEKSAKATLLEKLEIMGQLLERNVVLENSLSDLGAELEGVRGKLKALEGSYQCLSEEKSTLTVEKANLLGQLQVTTDNLSLVSEKNTVLENSLFDAHVKLEVLKQKSTSFEDSCRLLADEKSALITEKGTLVSQMEITEKSLNDLELKYTDLEEKYSMMEKERESTLRKVEELHLSLALQNQEHVTFAQKNEEKLQGLRSQIQVLQEENHDRSKEFEEELDKALESDIEIFILLRCVQDLEEKNSSLFNDCRKLQEASMLSENLVRVLKQEKTENQVKIKSLSDQNSRLKMGMHQLLKFAGLSGCDNGQIQTCFDSIMRKFEGTNCALIENEDKNIELFVEISILVTLLKQLKTEMADLEAEKRSIHQELRLGAEKILELQSEARKLSETNEELRSKVTEGDITEERLRTQLENLHSELSIVQGAYKTLQMDNSVVLEENKLLTKDNVHMNKRIRLLEDENDIIFDDVVSHSILSQTLKKYLDEKHAEINGLSGDLQKLHGVNKVIAEEMSMVEKKLDEVRIENLHLKEALEKSEHELETVAFVRDELNSELVTGNNLLHLKEREHKEAVQQLKILEDEKTELSEILSRLQRENEEVKTTRDEQGKQILKLLEDNDHLSKERKCLDEETRVLDHKMHQMTEDHQKTEESLRFELHNEKSKARLLETQGSEVYGDLQTSTFCQVILEEKIRELTEVCLSLQEDNTLKDVNTELLKERTDVLECENGDLKARLAAYGPALVSLRDCILSLENHICIRTKVQHSEENEEGKGAESITTDPDASVDFQGLEIKVKAIEAAVVELQMLSMQEKLDSDAKLESAMKQIEELSYQKSSRRPNGKRASTSEISEIDVGILPKDIMLDQASECSSYGVSKRGLIDGEIWESADKNGSIDMNFNDSKIMYKHHPTASDLSLDNEPDVVDKLEVSRRFREPRDDGNKRKVLERLNSDVQKLTNLQITIEDLKRKVEITGKSRRGKMMIECETLKGQLMEAESAIQKLYELNGKLVKHIEGNSESGESESESMRRKKVSEQARRVSEKIGRLQLEVQKIQFVLLKLDDEKESKGKTRFLDTKKRVLLKDYLYGGGRPKTTMSSNSRRRNSHFCACVEPATKGD
ncbi:hypothetical protein L6452_43213 [Arctium lappa]|uniref:Uncharacterized protein n=1 Tax=Arctium lappa TaxID=4217 RepID=A0ACB8XLI7_ARCLA|nr:hypothetical protein L6452_43213 [Arctium lappa]